MKGGIKFLIFTLSVAGTFAFTGCTSPANKEYAKVDSIVLNHDACSLFVGETSTLSFTTTPKSPLEKNITFSSSNTNVATVDEKGLITAIGAGGCTITATNPESNTLAVCKVNVFDTTTKSKASNAANKIIAAQKDPSFKGVDKVSIKEKYHDTLTVNGKHSMESIFSQTMVVSKSDAYFYICSDDINIKVSNGSKEYSKTAWTIYTNEYYDTYLFSETDSKKTYMVVSCSSYIGKHTRLEALYSVIDNLFTSGKSLITSNLADVIGSEDLKYISSSDVKNRGTNGDGTLLFDIKQAGSSIATATDENDMNIPAGTEYGIDIYLRWHFDNNYCVDRTLIQTVDYIKNDKEYVETFDIEYIYDQENVNIEYPNRDDYLKVDTIFDL